ncbi:MAG: hypothetical protein R3E79_38745 [Caldilineaceae bacterium]
MPTSYTTSYIPSMHGFHFANDFRYEVGVINFWGRCNGMSWVSLDYFNAGRAAPAISEVEFENKPRSGPAAAANNGTVQLFCLQDGPWGDRPVGRVLRGSTFSQWNYCAAGVGLHNPAVAMWPSGRTHMLVVGGDDKVWHCDFNGLLAEQTKNCYGYLPGFVLIEGVTGNAPALTAPFEGRLEAYAVGKDDHAMYFRLYEGGVWGRWAPMGHPNGITFNSNPAAVGWWGFMAVFVRGSNGAFWQLTWQDGRWQSWQTIDGIFTSGPAVCKVWDGRLHVFGRGLDGAIWIRTWDHGTWDGWTPLSRCPVELTTDSPAAVGGEGFVHVYAKATDETFWRLRWEGGGWQPWERVHNTISAESRRLTDAILERNLATTIRPLIAATAPLGIGLLFLGPVKNFVTWRTPSDDDCYHWSSTDELRKLITTLRAGRPLPLGLIAYSGWGHEVVAYGLESDVDLPPGSYESYALPAGRPWRIKVYDPSYPGCDNIVITLDPNSTQTIETGRLKRIYSSTGEAWRGFFVRDDYTPALPPL